MNKEYHYLLTSVVVFKGVLFAIIAVIKKGVFPQTTSA